MRLFDTDRVGIYLDSIDHRVEKTKDNTEVKMVDLTLRVQPFTPALASALDNDVRALLFNMNDGEPKPKIKAIEFKLPTQRQKLAVYLLPEETEAGAICFPDVDISSPRARTEKGVDGYALVFYASFGPVSKEDLEYLVNWHTQQRFITFTDQQPALDFAAAEPEENDNVARHTPRRHPQGATH